jgi:transglutaminase-like putative cysteine protease
MIAVTTTVSVVPGASGTALGLLGESKANTVEGSLIDADQRIDIQGSIELSPDVRFSVESDAGAYWRAGAYDLYTGDGWVRTGSNTDYERRLRGPPGRSIQLRQRVEIESRLAVLPAAWRPVRVSGADSGDAQVTDLAGLQPGSPFTAGDSYTVVSERPVTSEPVLRRIGRNYPERVEERYTKLPDSTPDRIADRTQAIADRADADTPYEVAEAVEGWLEANKGYSLDVERPESDVADTFLFEMNEGYCTYFATSMTTMLRSQGIPARFVVGYTRGERGDDGDWVVRGLDSHAWVEVYVPDAGWIRFDPTPATARTDAEQERLDDADGPGVGGSDDTTPTETPDRSPDPTPTPDATPGITFPDPVTPSGTGDGPGTATAPTTTARDAGGGFALPDPPSREEVALGVVLLAGLVAGLRRSGLAGRVYRAIWLRWQPRADPASDVERAFERLEFVLEGEYRPRDPGETPREYLAAIDGDEDVRQVFAAYERTRYAGDTSAGAADETVALVDRIVGDRRGVRALVAGALR